MPNNWKTYKLGEITKWSSGGTPPKMSPEYWGGEIPWISAKSLKGRYVFTSDLNVTEAGLKKGSKLALKGSILLLVRGSGLYNDIPVAMATKDVAYNQDVKCILPKIKELSNIFLLYWFKGNKVTLSNILEATGIGAGKFDMSRLLDLEFNLPPLEEQQSIASILSAIDDKIENNLAINKTLEEMAMALYKHWFVDFGEFQDGEFVESELGMIPRGWEVKRLDEIAYKRAESYKFKGKEKVVFVNTGDVLEGAFMHNNFMNVDDLPGQAKKAIYPEDILFSEIRPVNKRFAYVDFDSKEYVVSTKFMVIRNNELINNKLLYRILTRDETIAEFQNIAESRSGTFPQITFDVIGHIQFALPNIGIQNKFQSIVGNWEEQQSINLKENKSLTQLRDTLLPKLISGEVRLKEFQEQVATIL